jgi:tetratricopeptide (TPR) repeat protein
LFIRHRVAILDHRFFFYSSIPSAKGLVLYLIGDYQGSAKAYRDHYKKVYERYPPVADNPWYALLRGDLAKAKELAEKQSIEYPNSFHPLLTLGEISLEQNAYQEAAGYFDRVLEIDTDQYDALLLLSVVYANQKTYGKAIDSLNRALRHNEIQSRVTSFLKVLEVTGALLRLPSSEQPNCLLAHYHRYLRIFDPTNADTAVRYAKKAIAGNDRVADAYLTMGIVHSKQWNREQALQEFLKAIAINPTHAEALRWAGNTYAKRGDLLKEYQLTKAAYEAAPLDPFYADVFSSVLIGKLGDYHQALALNLKMLQSNPNDADVIGRLGYIYNLLGDFRVSIEYYQRLARIKPRSYDAYYGLGDNLRNLGRLDEAVSAYQLAASINPRMPYVHISIANIFHLQKRYKEAIAEYEQGFALGEDDASQLRALCYLYLLTSDFQRAAACYRSVLARRPDDISAQNLLQDSLRNIDIQKRNPR